MSTHASRYRTLLAGALATCLVLAACGGDDDSSTTTAVGATDGTTTAPNETTAGASTTAASGTSAAAPGDAAAYPVTIDHAFGSTTIEAEPERVVTIGFTDHDVVLALGVAPIAIRQWYGDYEYVWPWAQDALGDATPELLPSTDLNYEQIAALDPDLILGLYVGLEEDQYEQLASIAPTVAQSGEYPPFGTPWQEMTRTAGRVLGKSAEAEALVADVEALFTEARAAHPEFAGVGVAYAGAYGEQQYYVETEGSTRVQVLLELGFVVPDELAALGADAFYHEISAEQLELVDQDVVVWEPADQALMPAILADPLYQALAVHTDGREVLLTDPVIAGALAHSTVLSLPVVLDYLVPELARAVAALPA